MAARGQGGHGQGGVGSVSLTTELSSGPLADWFRDRFPGAAIADVLGRELAGVPRAPMPDGALGRGHWAAVGGAFGTRLAWAVEPAPPYYALLGAYNAGLVPWTTANTAAAGFPSHRLGSRPGEMTPRTALGWRPTPTGWVDTAPPPDKTPTGREWGTHSGLVASFAARAAAFLERVPPGGWGSPGEETVLARIALVLTDWEQGYRRGDLDATARAALADAVATWDPPAALLREVDPAALADVTDLIAHARTRGLLDTLADAAHPRRGEAGVARGHAFPTFVERWADGDLLLDPGAGEPTTLIDIKTITRVRDRSTALRWVHQLLGYAYLAALFCPEWRLGRVGLCFARHAHVVSWDLDELAGLLAGTPTPGAFDRERAGFERVFRETMADRGLQLT